MKNKNKGILCILLSGVFFASMSILVRMAGDLPTMQKAFFRNAIAAIVALIVLLRQKKDLRYQKKELPMIFIRSICGTAGIICNFYAIDHLVVSDANILNKVSPFAAVIFSYLFLKEKVNLTQVITLVGAFVGALFVIKPSLELTQILPGFIGLTGGIMAGAAYTAVRALGQKGVDSAKIVFFFSAFSSVVLLPLMCMNLQPMSARQLTCLIGAGVAAAIAQFCITKAYTYAPAREISIYDYFQIIVAAVLGFFIFGQVPDQYSLLGYVIIFGMSFYMWWKNNRK